jgi:phosphinothricin acetyltransferase
MIRPVNTADAPAICGIYNYYIANTAISFEEDPVSVAEMEDRIRTVTAEYPWFVREEGSETLAYAYVHKWQERMAYRYAAELSIYVKHGQEGRGMGRELMARLLEAVRETEIRALVSGITIPNDRSIALHEKFGFQKVARFNEIGFKLDQWLDVGYWELIIRSEE